MPDDEPTKTDLGALLRSPVLVALIVVGGMVYAAGQVASVVIPQPAPAPGPSPTVDLASLVPDPAARAKLAGFYSDFAAVLRHESKPLKTTGDFRAAHRLAVPVAQKVHALPSVKAIDQPISDLIAAAVGKADQPLDGEPPLRENLANALQSVSQSMGR